MYREAMERTSSGRVLVTGGTGFVGSHLVELLIAKGYPVTCLVRDPQKLRWLRGLNVPVLQGDCSDPASLVSAVRDVSSVVHIAGLTKAKHTRDFYRVNHLGTKNILEACARHNPRIKKFILLSSLAAAGPSRDGTPVRASDPPNPVSDYGKSKVRAEEETAGYKNVFPVVILRPSAVYGPRDRDMFELFRWAARGVTLEISGGERYINPCYVGDLAAAILGAMEQQTASGSIYFVAEKRQYSWSVFRETLLSTGDVKAVNIKIPYAAAYLIGLLTEWGDHFRTEPSITSRQKVVEAHQKYWVCDVNTIRKDLGLIPDTSLQQGLQLTWQWYRDNNWLH